jgi:hypothetical protein
MFGPPLEGFHRGATCVTTEVTGHEEYIEHGVNALVVDWDDRRGTARQLDLLARDRMLLHRLRCGALETARDWPDWDRAGELMAVALRAIADAPPPAPYAHVPRLLGDLRAGMEAQRLLLQERRELDARLKRAQRLERLPGISRRCASSARATAARRSAWRGRSSGGCSARDARPAAPDPTGQARPAQGRGRPRLARRARRPRGRRVARRAGARGGRRAVRRRRHPELPPRLGRPRDDREPRPRARGRGHVVELWLVDQQRRLEGRTEGEVEEAFRRFFGPVDAAVHVGLEGFPARTS